MREALGESEVGQLREEIRRAARDENVLILEVAMNVALRVRVRRLNKVDLPTLGRPTRATRLSFGEDIAQLPHHARIFLPSALALNFDI